MTHEHHSPHVPTDYEEMYSSTERVWSGNPNQNMVEVVQELTPGAVLDIGCGEGGDLRWLIDHGWEATGIDPSATALRRAADIAPSATLMQTTFEEAELGQYDLILASYAPLPRDASDKLSAALKPGGTVVILHHEEIVHQSPENYLMPQNAALLLPGWDVQILKKERSVTEGRGQHHHADLVAIARPNAES